MKVLIVSQYFWPETFRINEVVKSLRDEGCEVTVLTGQPNYPRGEIFDGYKASNFGAQQHEEGYTIYRVPLFPRGRGKARGLILNYLSFVLSGAIIGPFLLRKQQFDVIFVYAPSPILQAIPAILIGRLKGAKVVTWVQDLWPQSLEVTGFVRNKKILNAVATIVKGIYKRCDLLLAQSNAFIPSIEKMAGTTPVRYYPNPGELAFTAPKQPTDASLIFSPGFNVLFAGNLGTVQALDTILDAAELLLPQRNISILLVGSGSRSHWLTTEIARRGLSNVQLPGRFAPDEMPGIFAQASALLVSLVRDPAMSQTIPSKIQAYLAAGKPVIASLDGEGARIVIESGAGVACESENAQALAAAILQLAMAKPEYLERMGEYGRAYYKQHFDPSMLAKKLINYFEYTVSANCIENALIDNKK